MKAPFPYFGGKSKVASFVWAALGDPEHYMEPFFGSAVLLNRPRWTPDRNYSETVCDKDGFLANVWRGIQIHPEEVAKWCDWPINDYATSVWYAGTLSEFSAGIGKTNPGNPWGFSLTRPTGTLTERLVCMRKTGSTLRNGWRHGA